MAELSWRLKDALQLTIAARVGRFCPACSTEGLGDDGFHFLYPEFGYFEGILLPVVAIEELEGEDHVGIDGVQLLHDGAEIGDAVARHDAVAVVHLGAIGRCRVIVHVDDRHGVRTEQGEAFVGRSSFVDMVDIEQEGGVGVGAFGSGEKRLAEAV